jgi:hypothetical protein
MSTPRPGEIEQAELYLRMLTASAPLGSLLDVRYRMQKGGFTRTFLYASDKTAARKIANIGQRTDVYVGCAPRIRRRGTRADIAATALLWVDCDDAAALQAARAFTPQASMIVASGTPDHAHAYWQLTYTLDAPDLHDANWRLAKKLGGDVKCADATRILRVPGTWNHKQQWPSPVEILDHTGIRHRLADILTQLPVLDRPLRDRPRAPRRRSREQDPLHQIDPRQYIRLLTGRAPDSEGKIACPFHPDDTPSLHAYATPEQGWACYGCTTPDGKPLGGDIYTFASRLWGIPARGHSFLELQARLDDLFAIRRPSARASLADSPPVTAARERFGSVYDRSSDDRADR